MKYRTPGVHTVSTCKRKKQVCHVFLLVPHVLYSAFLFLLVASSVVRVPGTAHF